MRHRRLRCVQCRFWWLVAGNFSRSRNSAGAPPRRVSRFPRAFRGKHQPASKRTLHRRPAAPVRIYKIRSALGHVLRSKIILSGWCSVRRSLMRAQDRGGDRYVCGRVVVLKICLLSNRFHSMLMFRILFFYVTLNDVFFISFSLSLHTRSLRYSEYKIVCLATKNCNK